MSAGRHPTLAEAARIWARIGCLGFGGPAGQIALMHRLLVEERRWLGETRFLHALSYCMLLPGPEAMQLAVYIGWLLHGVAGGLVAGVLFVAPGALALLALSAVYALHGGAGLVAGVFFGLKAAVLALVVQALLRIGSRALGNAAMAAIALAAFHAIFAFGLPFPLIVLAAGLIGLAGARAGLPAFRAGGGQARTGRGAIDGAATLLGEEAPGHARLGRAGALRISAVFLALWLVPAAVLFAALGPDAVFVRIAGFFSVMAVVTFGGAYAVLAWVAQAAVERYGWLAPGEMLDGLALAETTPGPLILVSQFVGFLAAFRDPGALPPLLAGTLGALLTTWVTFVPCFLLIFLGAPFMERLRDNRMVAAALAAVTAAVAGVILNLALWFALHVLFGELRRVTAFGLDLVLPVLSSLDPAAAALTVAALAAVLRFRLGPAAVLGAAAAAGLALHAAELA